MKTRCKFIGKSGKRCGFESAIAGYCVYHYKQQPDKLKKKIKKLAFKRKKKWNNYQTFQS